MNTRLRELPFCENTNIALLKNQKSAFSVVAAHFAQFFQYKINKKFSAK